MVSKLYLGMVVYCNFQSGISVVIKIKKNGMLDNPVQPYVALLQSKITDFSRIRMEWLHGIALF